VNSCFQNPMYVIVSFVVREKRREFCAKEYSSIVGGGELIQENILPTKTVKQVHCLCDDICICGMIISCML